MTPPAASLRPAADGVTRRVSTASPEPVEKLHRANLAHELAEFVERLCSVHGSKAVAVAADRGYTAVRAWVGEPDRLPLLCLPGLLSLADPADPFLPRLAASLGYALVPLDPTPEQLAEVLERHGLLKRGSLAKAATVLRGVQSDHRQGRLWGKP